MQRAVLNRATMRVADTTDRSGRVTADSTKHGLFGKKQDSLWHWDSRREQSEQVFLDPSCLTRKGLR